MALRRESIGALQVEDALPLDGIDGPASLRPPLAVLGQMPRVELDEAARAQVQHGRAIAKGEGGEKGEGEEGAVALVQGDELVAVAEVRGDQLQPVVVLCG